MLKQELTVALRAQRFAVVDAGELRVAAQEVRRHRGHLRAGARVAAFDRDQNEARGRTVPQLVYQQPLRGGGLRRQERGQIGDVVGTRHDNGCRRDAA
jgi:hypothetical protein